MTLLTDDKRRLLAAKLLRRGIDATHLERRREQARAPARRDRPRLTFAQQRLWVLDRLEPGNPFYNISGVAELDGPLDAAILARAFAEIARRHESLRTTFAERDGVPWQAVAPPPDPNGWPLPVVDLEGLADRREAERLALAEARAPMDLARGPLVRTTLVRLGPTLHLLLVTLHHIISDGWSNNIFLREMAVLYEAFAAGLPSPLPDLPLQVADFAEQQLEEMRGERLEREISWWREQLAGAPAVLEIPADRPRPPVQTFRGARLALHIPAGTSRELHRLAREESATLFMVLLAAFGVLLRSATGQEDLLVGTPVANRRRPEIEGLIGFFANTLVLRLDLSGDPSFRAALGRVREMAHGAYAHQDLPFEKLVEELQPERDLSRSPLFQVLAVLQNAPPAQVELRRLALRRPGFDPGIAKYDLMLDLTELEEPDELGGGLRGALEYNTDLFDRATVERLAERFALLLQAVAAAPDRRLSEVPLLPEAERRLVVDEWAARPALPAPSSVVDLIEAQVDRTPGAPAVVGIDGQTLTYRELYERTSRLARHLLAMGLGPGARVGFALDRSPDLVISLLAILQAGAAYVPLDPAWPAERLAFMLEDAGAGLVLSHGEIAARLPKVGRVLDLERLDLSSESPLRPDVPISPDDLAYVLYTSGSTGRPKGVAMRHGPLVQLIAWQVAENPRPLRTLQYTSPSFDVSFQEIVSTWAAGGALVLISEEARRDPAALLARLRAERVGRLFLPFVALQQLAEAARGAALPESLREVVTAGEQLRVTPAVAAFFARLPGARLHNHYGPTETHVATAFVLEGDSAAWPALPPIGRPIAGARTVVADLDGQPAPVGAPGELLLGGALPARGYLDRPDLTAERFVPDPFAAEPGARLYRTGDLARWRPDGELELLGRIDTQVKIRGYRVEPGEVESALAAHPAVAAVAVVPRETRPGDRRLVAWVVPVAGEEVDPRALRSFVTGRLPDFMVPSVIASIASLPLTPSGKVDRRALARRAPVLPDRNAAFLAPRTPAEDALARIWAEILGVERAGATDHFFDLGGHSLLAMQVVARVRNTLGVDLPLRALFEAPVLADLAARIEQQAGRGTAVWKLPASAAPAGGRVAPLSFGQQRLWFFDRLEPGASTFNMPVALRLAGQLRVDVLARAFGEIVRRHDALRTIFDTGEDEEPYQIIHPASSSVVAESVLPLVDLAALPAERARAEAERRGHEEAGRPFDLARGPLWRTLLFRLAPGDHVSVTVLHHIVSDGWSLGILVHEVGLLYGAFAAGLPSPLPELPTQYADYAVWQRTQLQGEKLDEQLRWWRKALDGAPQVLEIPADRPRPAVLSHRGVDLPLTLPDALAAGLRASGFHEGATLFMTLLAGYATVLGRWTGRDDLLIGSPVAGRSWPELEGLIGFFVNDLTLRCDLSGDPPFRELVRRVRSMTLGAFAHQDLPSERLVEEILEERSRSRHPLTQVVFAFQNAPSGGLALPGLALTPFPVDIGVAKVDLNLSLEEDSTGKVNGVWEIALDLFDPPTIERMSGHLLTLLAGAVEDPGRPLSELPLLTANEQAQLAAWNNVGSEDRGTGTTDGLLLQDLFLAWEERQPDAPALIQGDRILSYRELRAAAERLARRLRALGVGAETRVALCFDETIERIVAVVGTLLAGGAWVPLDPAWPKERLAWMLEDSGAAVVLTREALRSVLPPTTAPVLWHESSPPSPLSHLPSTPRRERGNHSETSLSSSPSPGEWEGGRWERGPGGEDSCATTADNLAYIIYTSGSTGVPNGVMIRHRSVVGFIEQMTGVLALGPGCRVLHLLSFSFDASVQEVWVALASGAALRVAPREARLSGEALAEEMRRGRITHACLVPSLLAQLPEETELPDLRLVTVGGESCPAELANRWAPRLRLLNCYGPTETTVITSVHVCTGGDRREPPIGRPLAGTRLWVLDSGLRPVPIGVPGALWIAGTGLARGYQDRPGLTAERFVPDPLAFETSAEPGARLYRTGDLARVLQDGNLEFLGRLDRQVKIRGVRVELGEIEAALQAHPDVLESVVLVRAAQEKSLVAFAVPRAGTELSASGLRAFLRDRLPETLVPTAFVLLEALPRTPAGKVDRKALLLAQTEEDPAEAQAPLRTPTEHALAEIWTELLGLSAIVGPRSSFFDLGGHSLLATRLASQIRRRWDVSLPLLAVFEVPVLEEMAARIDRELLRAGVPEAPPLVPSLVAAEPGAERRRAPLSFAQRRLWFIEQLEPGSAAYHMVAALRLAGHFDVAALAGSFAAIVRRHETLRTTFEAVQGEPPRQVIADEGSLPLPVVDLSALPEERREAQSERLARAEAARPFDLARGPLARCLLVRRTPKEHILVAVMHHIVSDGWSMGVLVRELGELYAASQEGRPALLRPLAIQYADFAAWQNGWLQGSVLETLLGWWQRELAGAPHVLDLPTDRPRPPVPSRRGAEEWFALPAGLSAALRDLGQREGATPFMALLAGLDILLGRHAGQRDLLIGVPVSNRTRAEVEPLIGFFVNTLVHRGRLGGAPSFRDLLAQVRASSLGIFEHQDLPFERLVEELGVERSRSRTPLVQVLFVLQNAPAGALRLPGLNLEELPLTSGTARTDLVLSLAEHPENGAFVGNWEHSADLFDPATIRRLTRSFAVLLAGAVADPEAPIASLPLMPDEERHQVLVEWNQTATAWPGHASLGDLFVEQATRTPGAEAVLWSEGAMVSSMTWGELEERSARVARRLRALGVEPEERIGLLADRSPDLIAALLGILRAGGAYLPLDPSYPPERLAWMLKDAGARWLLTDRRLLPMLPAAALRPGLEVLPLDDAVAAGEPDVPLSPVPADALAYVMYTSGSTGRPKGVAVTHRNVVRLVRGADYADLGPEQVWLQFAPVSFDASTLEIWAPLLNGGRLALMAPGPASLDDLARAIARLGVTSLWLTSGLFHQMAGSRLEALASLRQLLAGGDALSPEHVNRVLEGLPGLALINGYGPTEGTTFTCCQRLTGAVPAGASVPIGRPIANARVYVLDEDLEPVPPGVAGELYVGGDGLARGYLGRPDLTAERFVPNPFSGLAGGRLYYTGDRVRWVAGHAALEFLGRRDGQVKIRGFRVEAGEVEAVLAGHPAVRQAVVMPREEAGSKALAAWLTLSEPAPSIPELQSHLRERLPEPMIPTVWTVLDDLPLTPNGKIDRRALKVPEAPEAGSGEPRTPLERDLVEICAQVLSLEKVGIHDNFFDLGGHSLLATQLMVHLGDRLGMEIPLRLVFDARDFADLADRIAAQQLEQVEDADMAALVDEMEGLSPEEMRAMLAGGGEEA